MTISDIDSGRKTLGFNAESWGVIADILSTLYSNPERSVLREYVANAVDAHTVAGVNLPVKVSLPTRQSPKLVVRDFGLGLNPEDMANTFLRYVNSSKTSDDTQIGALGIGAKSAFALSKTWTVASVHEGLQYVYAISSSDAGEPTYVSVIDGVPTTEQSGITVTVPISPSHLSHNWAASFSEMMLWLPEGSATAFANDNPVDAHHWSSPERSSHADMYGMVCDTAAPSYSGDLGVVMGGVRYVIDTHTRDTVRSRVKEDIVPALIARIEAENPESVGYLGDERSEYLAGIASAKRILTQTVEAMDYGMTLSVGMGAIDFAPSREAVKATPRTLEALQVALANTLTRVATRLIELRKMPIEERVRSLHDEVSSQSRNVRHPLHPSNTTWAAVGIGDYDIGVFDVTGKSNREPAPIKMHSLLSVGRRMRGIILITGVEQGKSVARHRVAAQEWERTLMVTRQPTAPSGYEFLFTGTDKVAAIMSYPEYLAKARETLPAQVRDTSTLVEYYVSENGEVTRRADTFDAISKMCRSTPLKVGMGDFSTSQARLAAQYGIDIILVIRGRRKVETFAKNLGREVLDGTQFYELVSSAEAASKSNALSLLEDLSDEDFVGIVTGHRVRNTYLDTMRFLASPSSPVAPLLEGHRVHDFVASAARGRAMLAESDDLKAVYSDLFSHTLDDDVRAAALRRRAEAVDVEPWVLSFTDMGTLGRFAPIGCYEFPKNDRAMATRVRHFAIYMAAVG